MSLSSMFWNEDIWLPPNVTWADVRPMPGSNRYTNFNELWYPIPAGLLIIFVRAMVMRRWFRPLGLYLGIKPSSHKKPPTNEVLEQEFQAMKTDKKFTPDTAGLSARLGLTERQIQSWLRRRKLHGKPSTMDKFCETGWRCLYYSGAFLYGSWCLWDKPWLWDIKHCWYNYPHHDLEPSVWWYYMVELAFYWSLSFSQFTDVRRKDFIEMFIHHLTTIALLSFSWTCNLTRCGALVLVVHDFSDIFLELAKMFHYAKLNTACDIIFGIFVVAWCITRLGLFPTWILFSATIEAPQMVEMFPAYYIFNGLLSVLLVLHVIWTYFILKIAFHAVLAKKDEELRDSRSDSEEETVSESDQEEDQPDKENKKIENIENIPKEGTNGVVIKSVNHKNDVPQDVK